ncbi:MAG: cation:proton antiporter [Holosporales bacterium]|jgi:CPA2 family monovalent cation:H+ antiporter-2|nr:cation:proton antiporter [Holosporales bacterium]
MNNEYVFAHLTIIILVAAASGILLAKLNQPVMIGYIFAGIIFGPSGLSFISSKEQIQFYSELGILLLLFIIGMELNIKSFIRMWKIPTLFTVIQVFVNAIIAILFATFFDFPIYISLLAAFIISLSSTAAIVKVLEHLGEMRTDMGHISIGILVAQDIAIVPMMLILKGCDGLKDGSIIIDLLVAIGLVVMLIRYLGRKEKIIIPTKYLLPSSDLTPIVALACCFAAAALVVLFGLSEAYGAFLTGLFIGNTQERQNVLNSVKPIQNVLLMAFFISVGLMFDLHFLTENWPIVCITLIGVTVWKIFSNTLTLKIFSIENAKAASIGIILAQLGEFSLVLANVATQSNIIDEFLQKIIVCVTALSLSISPILIMLTTRTKNLSFLGDHSVSSLFKILISRKFSKEVQTLSIKNESFLSKKDNAKL